MNESYIIVWVLQILETCDTKRFLWNGLFLSIMSMVTKCMDETAGMNSIRAEVRQFVSSLLK